MEKVAPGFVGGFGDADAGAGADAADSGSVVADPEAAGWGGEVASVVAGAGDAEGFGETPGAAGEIDQLFMAQLSIGRIRIG